jgi:hypothetical protein
MEGLKIKKFRKANGLNCNIGYTQILKYSEKDTDKYISKFNELKNRKIVLNGNFEDNYWILRGRERKAHLYFKYDFNKRLNTAIKIFMIIKIDDEKVNPRSLLRDIDGIDFVIRGTNCLDLNSVEYFKEKLESNKDRYIINDVKVAGYKFLCFYDFIKYKSFREEINKYNTKEYDNRKISNFISAILFDTILKEFMDSLVKGDKAAQNKREKYLPVMLWWMISSTIPLRPIEFSELETNAAKIVNGRYILSILNGKEDVDENNGEKRTYRHIDINGDLYNLIQEYIDKVDPERKEKYLFNYSIYSKHLSNVRDYDKFLDAHKDNYAGTERFYQLLNNFYTEIVEKEYGYKTISVEDKVGKHHDDNTIERIRPGDTRHFAICNLFLQGTNPLTIARLAGHDNIYTQLTYANHLKAFAESKVKLVADEIRRRKLIGEGLYSNRNLKELYNKSLFFDIDNYNYARPVDEGYCIDKDFPSNCILGDCNRECDYYRLSLNKQKDIVYLRNESNYYLQDIEKQINILKKLIRTSNLKKTNINKNRCFDIKEQEQIGICSKKIQQAIANKAIIESYIMKLNEVSNNDKKSRG